MKAGVPYRVFGGQKFYERKEIKDILAYMRVIANPADDISLARIINVPKRAIGETTVQVITEYASMLNVPMFSVLNDLPDSVGSRAKANVNAFFGMMTLLSAMKECMDLVSFADMLIEKTGIEEQYKKEDTEEAMNRLENISEFRNSLKEFSDNEEHATLEAYLENVSLVTDLDRAEDDNGYVSMMTLHSAKGLEFDNVFIPGLEENIFPSMRSVSDENRLEEERRLMYVGITRARKRLYLTRAAERMVYNQFSRNPPSRFLNEIPSRLFSEQSAFRRPGAGRMAVFSDNNQRHVSSGIRAFAQSESGNARSASAKPRLTYKGLGLDEIPGVRKGIVQSNIHGIEKEVIQSLFKQGDRVRHAKFGIGTVTAVTGSGKDARIKIHFESGIKELALAIAPIIRLEDEA